MSEIIAAIICTEAACQEGEFPEGHKSGSHKVAEMKEEGGQQRREIRPEDDGRAVTSAMLCRSSLCGEDTEAESQKQKIKDKEGIEGSTRRGLEGGQTKCWREETGRMWRSQSFLALKSNCGKIMPH